MHARLVIPRTAGPLLGGTDPVWKPARDEGGTLMIMVRCARGHIMYLGHQIDDDGVVSPSVVCPHSDPVTQENCDWHVMAELGGWPP